MFLLANRKKIVQIVGTAMLVVVATFFLIFSNNGGENETETTAQNLPETVLRWKPQVEKIAKKNNIPEYTDILLAIIMVESRGEGLDIMQSSESAGLGANGFSDPVASLEQGIKFFAKLANQAKDRKVDMWTPVQAYNLGGGYIDHVASNGKKHTTSLAEKFSKTVVAPQLGNSGGVTYSYVNDVSKADGRTYLYLNGGNFHYVGLVKQYITSNESGGKVKGGSFAYPLPMKVENTSGFEWRTAPYGGHREFHTGLDMPAPSGTEVYAAENGVIMRNTDVFDTYGINVVIKHSNGMWTRYAHLSKANVSMNQKVKKGQVIGYVGSTGNSTGPHLHMEVMTSMYAGHVDPRPYIGIK